MAVGLEAPGKLSQVKGIRLAATHSGIKADNRSKDLVLIEIPQEASVATVFTRNKFCAAPVTLAKQHLGRYPTPRYLLVNSGNANAGTGVTGIEHALACCQAVADSAAVAPGEVLPFSTGVIAAPLPFDRIVAAIPGLLEGLAADNWLAAAQGIMTTDTLPKAFTEQLNIEGKTVTITGIAKGSGMIKPDMATMLAFVATDARIDVEQLQIMLKSAVATSFNSITVDGDTSTNDACVLIASGQAGVGITARNEDFVAALNRLFLRLAQSIIRDAEGATKFVEIEVRGAISQQDAREVAYTIGQSPLVKTALFASDPNWGRILAAIGRARIDSLDISTVDLFLGDTCLLRNGLPDAQYTEQQGQREMQAEEIRILVNLNQGEEFSRIWTSDLSYEYVKVNAEYRS